MSKSDWVRSMRKQQGLKGFQLAERLQVSAARVSVLEKDEARGAVTLKMMAKAARALGCRFEYKLVPYEDEVAQSENKVKKKSMPSSINNKPRVRVVVK